MAAQLWEAGRRSHEGLWTGEHGCRRVRRCRVGWYGWRGEIKLVRKAPMRVLRKDLTVVSQRVDGGVGGLGLIRGFDCWLGTTILVNRWRLENRF